MDGNKSLILYLSLVTCWWVFLFKNIEINSNVGENAVFQPVKLDMAY